MASTNGILSPPIRVETDDTSITPSTKRKRDDDDEATEAYVNGTSDAKMEESEMDIEGTRDVIRDLIDVLKGYDTTPSILTRNIPGRDPSSEPQPKKAKGDDGSTPNQTIMTRVSDNYYNSMDEILKDIDMVVSDIRDMVQPQSNDNKYQHIPESEVSLRVTAFMKRARNLVDREKKARQMKGMKLNNKTSALNGNSASVVNGSAPVELESSRTVLTLYGNAPNAKQLFSSYQLPTALDGNGEKVLPSLRDARLPNGITTTQIVHVPTIAPEADKKRVPTLGELFAATNGLRIDPPKLSKTATTRSLTVGWYQPTVPEQYPRNASYSKQSISCGQWLEYTNTVQPQDSKKKHRDRTLSLGGSKVPQFEVDTGETETSKLEALFCSAYSSFAPTKDDSAAVASEGYMNKIWWQKVGEKSYERYVDSIENFEEITESEDEPFEPFAQLDLEQLEKMAEELEKDTKDTSHVPLEPVVEKSAEEKDIEEVLGGISELLETLNSYQRIRHMTLNASARPVGALAASDPSNQGTPSKPTESEQATYEVLRTSLELLIGTLPPYAVAKLDADRLSDLCISTKIEIQQEDHKGVMEEEEASARARAALNASTNSRTTSSSLHRSTSSSQMYGNQFTAPRPANSNHYYNNTHQTPVRPPAHNVQRPPATAPAPYQPHRQAANVGTYRQQQPYGTPGYQHQTPRTSQPQYPATNTPHYYQNSNPQFMRPQGQNYQSQTSTLTPTNGGYPRTSYSGPATQGSLGVQYGNTANIPRQSSPQKPYSPQPTSAQPRPYGTPTPTPSVAPPRGPYTPTTQPVLNGSTPQPSAQTQYARQHTGFTSTFMTQAEQSSMMERQRAQLAQHQGSQQQARNVAQSGMDSQSKPQVNGNPVPAGL